MHAVDWQAVWGLYQSTGWPTVVAVVGNWFPKGKSVHDVVSFADAGRRGLVLGVWNAHASIGNIVGAVLPAALLSTNWCVFCVSLAVDLWQGLGDHCPFVVDGVCRHPGLPLPCSVYVAAYVALMMPVQGLMTWISLI